MAVTKYDQPDRPSPYGVKWTDSGKRKFKFFKSKADRNDYYNKLVAQEKKSGSTILQLSASEAATMRTALDLVGTQENVLAACREWKDRHSTIPVSASDAIAEYLEEKTMLGRDINYHRAIRKIMERLQHTMADDMTTWDASDARTWSRSLAGTFQPVTVKNHIKNSGAFCRWAIKRNYIKQNPFAEMDLPDVIRPEPETLTVKQTRQLFTKAVEFYPQAVAYLALGSFAGIRSSATAKLGLENIDFDNRGIRIRADAAKNKRRIFVDGHEDNLWEWLDWAREHAPEGFSLTKRQWDSIRGQVAKKAKVTMPHNALRHSFCTYHVALHGDAGKTATLLTHRGHVSILYEHYKGNATRKEGQDYFRVVP